MMDLQKLNKKDLLERIKPDKNGNFSLTELWKLTSNDTNTAPARWQQAENVQGFIKAVCKILNVTIGDIIKSKRGKGGGTYAHKQIFLEYAQYLDAELAVLVNEVFFERIEEEKNPDLAIERGMRGYSKKGMSPQWITKRLHAKGIRNEFTGALKEHGVIGDGYKECTNAMYVALYGGPAKKIREVKNLPAKANIRENMSTTELAAISLSESLAIDDIHLNRRWGNEECALSSHMAAREVSKSILEFRRNR